MSAVGQPSELDEAFKAAADGDVDRLACILQQRRELIDRANPRMFGHTLLGVAAMWGHVDVVRALIQLGSRAIDAQTQTGCTPLWVAAEKGHAAMVEELHRLGSRAVDQSDHAGCTPLYVAAQNGHRRVVKTLLRLGSTALDAARVDGSTPIMISSNRGRVEVVRLLLHLGADTSARYRGRTAGQWAKTDRTRRLFDVHPRMQSSLLARLSCLPAPRQHARADNHCASAN